MLTTNFYIALSSSFWIIPREGTEALLVIIMLCSALKESGRADKLKVIYVNCIAALGVGLLLAIGCVWLDTFFTGQMRELSEAFASLIAMSMLLYVNFETFNKRHLLHQISISGLGFLAFISVFRELAETILFYYALFQGGASQQLGTLTGLLAGIVLFGLLLWLYKSSTDQWKIFNRLIFNLTPVFIFILSLMCIGNAINSFQEAGWIKFTPVDWFFNSDFFHIQASEQYVLSVLFFLISTGLLFLKQFYNSLVLAIKFILNKNKKSSHQS
ncbi:FTR1 family iron permease [Cysteiniphilum halobium]|uniref:FTR1 family iron permease n=1 Tax=Cysteiniphilum halobium TaxID=2219059 RepID=UPI003F865843